MRTEKLYPLKKEEIDYLDLCHKKKKKKKDYSWLESLNSYEGFYEK